LQLGRGPGNLSQNGQKPTPLMMSPTKKENPKPKIFFQCKLEDLLSHLRVWTAL